MKKYSGLIIFIFTVLISSPSLYAPLGVSGDYVYEKNNMKVSYRYMNMYYSGNNQGSNSISGSEIYNNDYSAYGRSMTHDMHSLEFAYAVTDIITVSGSMNFSEKNMSATEFEIPEIPEVPGGPTQCELDFIQTGYCNAPCDWIENNDPDLNCAGFCMDPNPNEGEAAVPEVPASNWTMASTGLADLEITSLIKVFENDMGSIHANIGLTLPTGKIDELDKYYMEKDGNDDEKFLPFPMQLGSGTIDPVIGFTGKYNTDSFSIGAQIKGTLRVTDNEHDYSLGNKTELNIWGIFNLFEWMGITGRLTIEEIGKIEGTVSVATSDLTPYGGYIENTGSSNQILGVGANFIIPSGNLDGDNVITIEYELPIKQDVNGIQMTQENNLMIGWQYAF